MKVLIAVDESKHAEQAFNYYFEHLHKEENEVIVYRHAEAPGIPRPWIGGMPLLTHEEINKMVTEHKQKCHKIKENWTTKCAPFGSKVKVAIDTEDGGAGHNIVKKAETCGCQLIVTGTRGLGTVRRTIIGSVSDYVLHHSKVPVLVCHCA